MSETAPSPNDPLLRQQIAVLRTDPNRWLYGSRILPDDAVLASRGAGRGLWLYDELERDPQVGCELGKRKSALVGREWQVQPGDDTPAAQDVADLVTRQLQDIRFNQAVRKALGALLRGLSILEVVWLPRDKELVVSQLLDRDPRRFSWADTDTGEPELRLLTRVNPMDGDPTPARKFIVHRHGGNYEDPWGLGLGNRLFWPVYFKRQGVGFWLSALEKFAQPTILGKYPNGTPDDEQDKLMAALQAIASEAGVTVPDGMSVELLEAKRSGTFDSYESLAAYMDADISKVILGGTLTTQPGANGNRSLGEVQDGVRLEITKADADDLSDTLNSTLIPWIVEFNRPGYLAAGGRCPKLWWDVQQPEDLVARADRDTKIRQLGYKPTDAYIADTYGEGWVPDQAPPPAAPAFAELFAEARGGIMRPARLPPAADPRDAADMLAEQLGQVASDALDGIIGELRHLVDHAESLEAVRAGLVTLYPNLPVAQLAELMGQALTVAALTGRGDMADGV